MDEFFQKKDEDELVILEENKKELGLAFNNFKQPAFKKNLEALSQLILNLMFLVPGTYPNLPEMGINIKQYQFEFLTDNNLRDIEDSIFKQIQEYMPSSQLVQVIARTFKDPVTNLVNLGIGFAVTTDITETQQFFIFFSQDNKYIKSKVIS